MNLQYSEPTYPLRVMVINPLCNASRLLITKILSGSVFGKEQRISMTLVVYSNDINVAKSFVVDLENCAFPCLFSIDVTSNMPGVSDADVFCFITKFRNPNFIHVEDESDEQFDSLYLMIKIADHFEWPPPPDPEVIEAEARKPVKRKKPPKRKPIFMTDGLASLALMKAMSKKLPNDLFFCPSPIPAVSRTILAEALRVECTKINTIYVWACDDHIFHVDVEKPYILHDKMLNDSIDDWTAISRPKMDELGLDPFHIGASWMRKTYLEKIKLMIDKNPYGCIYRANAVATALRVIWSARADENKKEVLFNVGTISDGSLNTIKGKPYVLPLIFTGESWRVNKVNEEDAHLKIEIKRMNKAIRNTFNKLMPFSRRFLERNVVQKLFIPIGESTPSFTLSDLSSSDQNRIDIYKDIPRIKDSDESSDDE